MKPLTFSGLIRRGGRRMSGGKPTKPLTAKQRLAEWNEKFCIVRIGGKTKIFAWEKSPVHRGAVIPVFYSPHELGLFFASEFATQNNADGTSRRTPLFVHWMRQASTPRATGVTLDATAGRFIDERLNLWCGFGKVAATGAWPLLRAHIETVVCDNHAPSIDYLFKWLAWTLQNPAKPSGVAVVMRGLKGTGKGILARVLLDIFASHGLHISKREHLSGRFNSHLMHCCFIFLDEAIWPGDKAGEGTLKRIVTEPTLTIEPKGIDAGEAVNRLSIIMASNEDWVCPASNDERRFAVFNVSDVCRKDTAYFAALVNEVKTGGTEAFFADMLAMELGNWHPREGVPETDGLAMQKQESAGPEMQWLWNILEEGMLPDATHSHMDLRIVREAPDMARSQPLWENCIRSDQRLRYGFNHVKFGRFLATYGVKKVRRARCVLLLFPPLAEIRAKFLELNSWAEPFTPGDGEWVGPVEFQ